MTTFLNHNIAEVISQLSAETPEVAAEAARVIKNAIIANPTNKRLYLQHGVLSKLVTSASKAHVNPSLAEHSVAALGSLASFLPSEDVPTVANSLLGCLFSSNLRPVHAAARSLKLLVCSPPVEINDIATILVQPQVARKLISLLSTPNEGVAEVSAVIIAHTAECGGQYARIYHESEAVPALVALLTRTVHERCSEACINALTALARRLSEISVTLTTTQNIIPCLIPFIRTPIHSLRLATCRLLTTFQFTDRLPVGLDASVTKALVTLLSWNSHSALDVAAQTLAELIVESKDLQRVAKESGAVVKLADILLMDYEPGENEKEMQTRASGSSAEKKDVQMGEASANEISLMDEEEAEMGKLLRGSALTALSAITKLFDPARDAVISKNLLPIIVEGLADDNSLVVEGSISCIRSLSRSVKILREKLSDDEVIGKRVVSLLETENKQILQLATAALCNLVLEFSPVRKIVLELNGINTVIDLLKSKDEVVRRNCVWVLKNLLFKADMATKNGVLSKLGHDSLRALFCDEQPKVRSLAMTVVRNLACSSSADTQNEQLDALFSITGVELISMLSAVLNHEPSSDIELVIQALYVVCNIASGTEQHKAFLLESDIPQLILKWTCHQDDRVRIAAVWCTINLSWRDNVMAKRPEMALAPSSTPSQTLPHRRHLRVMRRTLRGPNRSLYEGRLQMMLRHQHLPLPSSTSGRRALERHAAAISSVNAVLDSGRPGSASSDGGNDDMWLVDRDNNNAMMDEDAAAGDIDGNQSESNQSEDSNGNNNNNMGANNNFNNTNNAMNDSNNMQQSSSLEDQQNESTPTPMQTVNDNETPQNRTDEDSDLCPSGYEASGSGGVDGSAGEGDLSGSNSSVGKSCGYEWRIERLRQLGFEGRLRSLINDPHIEVQGRARAALQLFDCNDAGPLDYNPSSLLIGNRTDPSLSDSARENTNGSLPAS